MKFVPVDPAEVPNLRESHRGRVSYPILKSFMETNLPLAKLDRTGMQQSLQALTSSLNAYIRNHDLPVKMFSRRGEIYLLRLDIDEQGNPILNWRELAGRQKASANGHSYGEGEGEGEEDIPEIDEQEVAVRFNQEKRKVTK